MVNNPAKPQKNKGLRDFFATCFNKNLQEWIKYSIIYSFTKPLRGRVKKYKAF